VKGDLPFEATSNWYLSSSLFCGILNREIVNRDFPGLWFFSRVWSSEIAKGVCLRISVSFVTFWIRRSNLWIRCRHRRFVLQYRKLVMTERRRGKIRKFFTRKRREATIIHMLCSVVTQNILRDKWTRNSRNSFPREMFSTETRTWIFFCLINKGQIDEMDRWSPSQLMHLGGT